MIIAPLGIRQPPEIGKESSCKGEKQKSTVYITERIVEEGKKMLIIDVNVKSSMSHHVMCLRASMLANRSLAQSKLTSPRMHKLHTLVSIYWPTRLSVIYIHKRRRRKKKEKADWKNQATSSQLTTLPR